MLVQGLRCSLSGEERQSLLNQSSRVWSITDDALDVHDLQEIINCTTAGDTVNLETINRIQPQSRIVIPWQLTIGRTTNDTEDGSTNILKASMTCPPREGLFLVQ